VKAQFGPENPVTQFTCVTRKRSAPSSGLPARCRRSDFSRAGTGGPGSPSRRSGRMHTQKAGEQAGHPRGDVVLCREPQTLLRDDQAADGEGHSPTPRTSKTVTPPTSGKTFRPVRRTRRSAGRRSGNPRRRGRRCSEQVECRPAPSASGVGLHRSRRPVPGGGPVNVSLRPSKAC